MITKKDEFVLSVALASESVASEIAARTIESSANPSEAQALLDIITPSEKESEDIKKYLTIACTSKEVGEEIAEQLDLIVECLQYQAADDIANNAVLNAAQAKIKSLSDEAKKRMVIACASKEVAERIVAKIEAAGQVAANIADAV